MKTSKVFLSEPVVFLSRLKKQNPKNPNITYRGKDIDCFLKRNNFKVLINDDTKVFIHEGNERYGVFVEYSFVESKEIIHKVEDDDCSDIFTLKWIEEKASYHFLAGRYIKFHFDRVLSMTVYSKHYIATHYVFMTDEIKWFHDEIKDNMTELKPEKHPYYHITTGCHKCFTFKHYKMTVDEFNNKKIMMFPAFYLDKNKTPCIQPGPFAILK